MVESVDITEENVITKGIRKDRLDASFFEPGEYGKRSDGNFYGCAPGDEDMMCNLGGHNIIEHDDGTITVSPSILITTGPKTCRKQWHGYLEKGVWREA